jgi:hypothetical protein
MELSDFILDIEGNKMISSFALGSFVGLVWGLSDLDSTILNSNKKFVSDSSEVNLEFSKNFANSLIAFSQLDYTGSLIGNVGEFSAYAVSSRLGYNFGRNILEAVRKY